MRGGSFVRSLSVFGAGALTGVGGMLLMGAAPVPRPAPQPLRPVEVTLHRFDMKAGQDASFRAWIDFLHAHHGEAVGTLARERTYFEAMFTAPDEPRRLYWITVQGTGGQHVESSDLDLDRKHMAYMDAVLARGSHARLVTQNVLVPDFVLRAVRQEQEREKP